MSLNAGNLRLCLRPAQSSPNESVICAVRVHGSQLSDFLTGNRSALPNAIPITEDIL